MRVEKPQIYLEILHEGEHWIPCVYMARVVEAVAPEFGDRLRVEKIVTRTMAGAKRYQELVRCLGRQLPVPSILINGALVFEITPGAPELKMYLNAMINSEPIANEEPPQRSLF